jgi:hypothetical protein
MAETNISVTDALRGQQEQLKRLLAQQNWFQEASKATLSEVSAQIAELQRLLDELDSQIARRLNTDR